jgi:hypothetical protein
MNEAVSPSAKHRADRRINVHLPMWVRGRDRAGVQFEESTSSENLCQSGAAFATRYELDLGADLEITIPMAKQGAATESNFATQGRVVHVVPHEGKHTRTVGVQFTGPRFRRVFRPESS